MASGGSRSARITFTYSSGTRDSGLCPVTSPPSPAVGCPDKDLCHQDAWEAQLRSLEPGLVGRTIGNIKEGFPEVFLT